MNYKDSITIGMLLLNSFVDFKKREILLIPTTLYGIAGLFFCFWVSHTPLPEILCSSVPGIFLLLIGRVSRGKVGYGDGILVLTMGIWNGFLKCLFSLTAGLLLASFWAVLTLLVKKYRADDELPFVPFLLFGYLIRSLP